MTPPQHLGPRLRPCGPIVDVRAAEHAREALAEAAQAGGWLKTLDEAWPALAPVFAASPYLAGLARRDPSGWRRCWQSDPQARLEAILDADRGAGGQAADAEAAARRPAPAEGRAAPADRALRPRRGLGPGPGDRRAHPLRRRGGAPRPWRVAARGEIERRAADRAWARARRARSPACSASPWASTGAFELNYSSDIDISVFFDPDALPLAEGVEAEAFAVRLTQRLSDLMQDAHRRRLCLPHGPAAAARPVLDPGRPCRSPRPSTTTRASARTGSGRPSSRPAPAPATCRRGQAFLDELQPFVWRTQPRLRRHRRHPFDQAPDPRPQGRRAADRPRAST